MDDATKAMLDKYFVYVNLYFDDLAAQDMRYKENPPSDTIGLLKNFQEVIKYNDLATFYAIEEGLLKTCTSLYKTDAKKALKQLEDAKPVFDILLEDNGEYPILAKAFSSRTKDKHGLPLDPMRQYLKSQKLRLSKRLAFVSSLESLDILQACCDCVEAFEKAYIEKQAKALHIHVKPAKKAKK